MKSRVDSGGGLAIFVVLSFFYCVIVVGLSTLLILFGPATILILENLNERAPIP